jgi:CRP-like cAMP-binding protein
VRTLSRGDHFGELALIKNCKRTMSIRVSSGQCTVLALERDTFKRILGDIKNYLKGDYEKEFDKKYEI